MNNLIFPKVDRIIPYVNEHFITFPLAPEGKYIPHINFWQILNTEKKLLHFDIHIDEIFANSGYKIVYLNNNTTNTIHYYAYTYIKKDWSIEEMLDLIGELIMLNSRI